MTDYANKAYVSWGNTAQYGNSAASPPVGLRVFDLNLRSYRDVVFPLLTSGTLQGLFAPGSILATSDKKHLYVFQQSSSIGNYVAEIDPATDTFVRYISAPSSSPFAIGDSFMAAISPDNKFIICLSKKDNITFNFQLFDLSTGVWIKTLMAEMADTIDSQRKLLPINQYPFFDRPEFSLDGAKCYIPANLTCKNSSGYAVTGYPCIVEFDVFANTYGYPVIINDIIGKTAMTTMGVTPTPVFSQSLHDAMLIPRSIVASKNHPGRMYCFGNMNRLGNNTSRVAVLDFINRTQEIYDTGNTASVGFPPFLAVLEQDSPGADHGIITLAGQSGLITEYAYNASSPVYASPGNNVGAGSAGKSTVGRCAVDGNYVYAPYQSPAFSLDPFTLGSTGVPYQLITPDSPLYVLITVLPAGTPPKTPLPLASLALTQDAHRRPAMCVGGVGSAPATVNGYVSKDAGHTYIYSVIDASGTDASLLIDPRRNRFRVIYSKASALVQVAGEMQEGYVLDAGGPVALAGMGGGAAPTGAYPVAVPHPADKDYTLMAYLSGGVLWSAGSYDGGVSWRTQAAIAGGLDFTPTGRAALALLGESAFIAYASGNNLYAATGADRGNSWAVPGLAATSGPYTGLSLLASQGRLYLLAFTGSTPTPALFTSPDLGATWAQVTSTFPAITPPSGIGVTSSTGTLRLGLTHTSSDDGHTWIAA